MINIHEKNKLFESLEEKDLKQFFGCANPREKSFLKGEILLNQGEEQNHLYLITQGEVELLKEDYEGNRSLVGALSAGDTYGEQTIFGKNNKNGFTLVAAKDTKVMYINKDLFFRPCSKVCEVHQNLIQNMLSLLANQANLLEKKITYLTAKGLRRKIALYLLEQWAQTPESQTFTLPLSREEMSEYFDVQRPSLSRELIAMKQESIIDYHRNTFKITDMEKLKELTT